MSKQYKRPVQQSTFNENGKQEIGKRNEPNVIARYTVIA